MRIGQNNNKHAICITITTEHVNVILSKTVCVWKGGQARIAKQLDVFNHTTEK